MKAPDEGVRAIGGAKMRAKTIVVFITLLTISKFVNADNLQSLIDKEIEGCNGISSCISVVGLCAKRQSVGYFRKCLSDNNTFYNKILSNERDRLYLAVGMAEAIFSMQVLSNKPELMGYCLPSNITSSMLVPVVRQELEKIYIKKVPQQIFFMAVMENVKKVLVGKYRC